MEPSELRALGFATDLRLLLLQGSEVSRRDGYLVLRTPANPTYHWGNCLILDRSPARGALAALLATFRSEFPAATHVAIGIDQTPEPDAALDPDEARALGLEVERDVVLTCADLVPSELPPPDVECRVVNVDDVAAWAGLVELEMATYEGNAPDSHREFVARRFAGVRELAAAEHGAWFAAYTPAGRPVCTLGLFSAGPGLARYQSVATDPEFRRQGIAGSLVRYAGTYGFDVLNATSLVIVADPAGPAIGLYRAAGFVDHQEQTSLYAAPS
jgi:ribosomal protein S18 acetylase RimI-like enzyme